MTDHDLLQQYTQGQSNDAMCELVRRHIDMVHATARRELGDAHLADDVTQAVFLVLMRRAAKISSSVPIGGWLFKTTMYAVANIRRGVARREAHEREAREMKAPDTQQPPDPAILRVLNEGIAGLSATDRHMIVSRYLEGRSTEEVGTALGISEAAVRQRLSRAVGRLRRRLAKRGVVAAAAAVSVALESSKVQTATASVVAPVEAMVRGAVPSASIQTIVRGVLQMLRHAQTLSLSVVAGIVCAIIGTGVLIAAETGAPPASAPAAVAGASAASRTTPAATRAMSKFGPARTPKGTLEAAFAAALAGDPDGMSACFQNPTDADKVLLRNFALALSGFDVFAKAVEKQFGKDALTQLNQSRIIGGVDPTEIGDAKETIDGDKAIVDIGRSGPQGGIPMIKVGDVWKMDPAVFGTLNKQAVEASAKLGPSLVQLAKDIEANKYANLGQALTAAQKALQAIQKGGGTPEGVP
jgi:RNA polymerase sigma factor (sigma-70 family)